MVGTVKFCNESIALAWGRTQYAPDSLQRACRALAAAREHEGVKRREVETFVGNGGCDEVAQLSRADTREHRCAAFGTGNAREEDCWKPNLTEHTLKGFPMRDGDD